MRRRLLVLSAPVLAATLIAPVVGTAGGSSLAAGGKSRSLTLTTRTPSQPAGRYDPQGRRWN